mgnify:CR=1 FL=1
MGQIKIPPSIRGSIVQRGKNSFRVRLSLGRGPDGKYIEKAETVRGTAQDAVDLLIRWNVQYLEHDLHPTSYETVQQAYEQWMTLVVKKYRAPNTVRFYQERFESDILPAIGHKRLKHLTLLDLQTLLAAKPAVDHHNKKALRVFFNWCADMSKCARLDFQKLETTYRPKEKTEKDVWTFDQVQKVYGVLTFNNLYDIFIVLGIEAGLRPQEIFALTWDKIHEDYLVIDSAVKARTPTSYDIGATKTSKNRLVPTTPYLLEKLTTHRINQELRIANAAGYNRQANLVVADSMGNVPYINYVRKYLKQVAKRAGVHPIPAKNLRSTYISLLTALGVPLSVIQESVGHSRPDVTSQHYIRVFEDNLRRAAIALHQRLHGDR